MAKRGTRTRRRGNKSITRRKLRGGNVPTFHFLITSAGRPCLSRMLDSLRGELKEGDGITVVFDGPEAKTLSTYNDSWKEGFKGVINVIVEEKAVKEWGHKLRDKYQAILNPKTTFVMHGDDDDAYVPGFLDILRTKCNDSNTLYIGRMTYIANKAQIVPNSTNNFRIGNIGTPNGIIPYDLVGKSHWPTNNIGDYEYYSGLLALNPPVVYLDDVIYTVHSTANNKKTNAMRGGSTGNIYIFYHIYCNPTTIAIVQDQVTKILYSGLYEEVKTIYCFLSGTESNINHIKAFIETLPSKFTIKEIGKDDTSYERFTLDKIAQLVGDEDKFLYIHSKGVSRTGTDINMWNNNIYLWRSYIEYFLIKRYKDCLEKLKDHDIVSVLYRTRQIGPHYSGNFWWSTGAYYKRLTSAHKIGDDYSDTEAYLFKGGPKHAVNDDGKVPEDYCLYGNPLYPKMYMNGEIKVE